MILSFVVLTALAVITFHKGISNSAAGFLVHSDLPQKADLIYILGGNYDVRAPAAAKLFRHGWAPKILLAREPDDEHGKENFTDRTQQILIRKGIPASGIIQFSPGSGVRSTADEAKALKLYLETYPAGTVLVVTSAFHSRRAGMAMRRAVPRGVNVLVVPAEDPDCGVETWRRTAFCRNEVETEWVKFVYYFFTFFG